MHREYKERSSQDSMKMFCKRMTNSSERDSVKRDLKNEGAHEEKGTRRMLRREGHTKDAPSKLA